MEFPGPEPRCQSRRWKSAEQKFLWLLYGRWLFRDIMAKISPQLILWESIMYDRLAVRLRPPRIIEHRRDVSNIDRKMRKKKSCSTLFSANAVAFEWKNWLQRLRWEPLPRFRTQWSQLCYQGFVLASVVVYLWSWKFGTHWLFYWLFQLLLLQSCLYQQISSHLQGEMWE